MRLRVPIWTLMIAILVTATGFAALRHPTELVASGVFTLAVSLIGVAVVVAVATQGRKRLAYVSFATFSVIYLAFAFGPFLRSSGFRPPPLLPVALVTSGLRQFTLTTMQTIPRTPVRVAGSDTLAVLDIISFSLKDVNAVGFISAEAFYEPFYQVGHGLASLLVGFIAAVVTLVVTAFKRAPETP